MQQLPPPFLPRNLERRTVVLHPPHTLERWKEERRDFLRERLHTVHDPVQRLDRAKVIRTARRTAALERQNAHGVDLDELRRCRRTVVARICLHQLNRFWHWLRLPVDE